MSVKRPRLVHVVWWDASHGTATWESADDLVAEPDMRVDTVGFLAKRSKTCVQVAVSATEMGDDGLQYGGLMTIPMKCVISLRLLPADTLKA